MFKTILVPTTGSPSDRSVLDTAYLAGRSFGAHIQCLHVRRDPALFAALLTADDFTAGAGSDEIIAVLEDENTKRAKRARVAFEEFCKRRSIPVTGSPPGPPGVSAEWRETEGDVVETIIKEARYYDLTVMGRSAGPLSRDGIGAILVGSGRPLLLATSRTPENLGGTIAVAWKNTPEAARALAAAGPLFAPAKRLVLLCAPESDTRDSATKSAEKAGMLMQWSGLNPEVRCVDSAGRLLQDAVLETAAALGADLLVMGGYGHSRTREFVFGGFTQHVLAASPLPVLLVH